MVDLVPELQVALQPRPAQVEVAVLEARCPRWCRSRPRSGRAGVFASDRTRISRASTSTVPVASLGFTVSAERARDLAGHREHVLAAHLVGGGVGVLRHLGPRHHLADPLAVAQVDEHDAPEVAPRGGPAHERDGLPHVALAQRPAVVGAGRGRRAAQPFSLLLEVLEDAASLTARPPGRAAPCRARVQTPFASSSSPRIAAKRAPELVGQLHPRLEAAALGVEEHARARPRAGARCSRSAASTAAAASGIRNTSQRGSPSVAPA